jgi:hypothetical protein
MLWNVVGGAPWGIPLTTSKAIELSSFLADSSLAAYPIFTSSSVRGGYRAARIA